MLEFILLLDNSRTISEASSQKHTGGSGGKEYLIRWRLSAIIALRSHHAFGREVEMVLSSS